MAFPEGDYSQHIASYLLSTLVAIGIIGNLLLVLWRSFREHKILIMPLKLANVFGDLAEVCSGLALILLLLYQDMPFEGICKGGGHLLMFATLISTGTLLITLIILFLWLTNRIVDRGDKLKGKEVNIRIFTIITIATTAAEWFLGLLFGFLPLLAPSIDSVTPYVYDCIPIRIPGENSWGYSLVLILFICFILCACSGLIFASFSRIHKLEKEFSDITISQYRSQKRKSLMKRTVRLAAVDVARWGVLMCGVVISFTAGNTMDKISLKWTLGYLLAIGITLHALLPIIIHLKNTPNKNCFSNKDLDITFHEGVEIPECFQDAKSLPCWNKRSGILNLLVSWYHGRHHLEGVMKVFPLQQKSKWSNEVRAANKLSKDLHNNVAQYLWASRENRHDEMLSLITGMLFGKSGRIICRAHCELGSLRRLLMEDIQQLTEGSLHSISLDVVHGLAHLKNLGLLHNKLSTHCVYITGSFQSMTLSGVIADFEEAKDVCSQRIKIKPRKDSSDEEASEIYNLSQLTVDQNLFAADIRSFALVLLEMIMSVFYFRTRPGRKDTVANSRRGSRCSSVATTATYQSIASTLASKSGQSDKSEKRSLVLRIPTDTSDDKSSILDCIDENGSFKSRNVKNTKDLQKYLGLEPEKHAVLENEMNQTRDVKGLGTKFSQLDVKGLEHNPRASEQSLAYSRHSNVQSEEVEVDDWDSTLERMSNVFSPRVTSAVDFYGQKASPVADKKMADSGTAVEGDMDLVDCSPPVSDIEDEQAKTETFTPRLLKFSGPDKDVARNHVLELEEDCGFEIVPYEDVPLSESVPIDIDGEADDVKSGADESIRSHGSHGSRLEYLRTTGSTKPDRTSLCSLSIAEDSQSVRSHGCESRLEFVRTGKYDTNSLGSSSLQSRRTSLAGEGRGSKRSSCSETRIEKQPPLPIRGDLESTGQFGSLDPLIKFDANGRRTSDESIPDYNDNEVASFMTPRREPRKVGLGACNLKDSFYAPLTKSMPSLKLDMEASQTKKDGSLTARVISVDTGGPEGEWTPEGSESPGSSIRMAWEKEDKGNEKIDPKDIARQKNAAFSKGLRERDSGLRRSLRERLVPGTVRFQKSLQKNKVHSARPGTYVRKKPLNAVNRSAVLHDVTRPVTLGERNSRKIFENNSGARPSGSNAATGDAVSRVQRQTVAAGNGSVQRVDGYVPPDLASGTIRRDDFASDSASYADSPSSSAPSLKGDYAVTATPVERFNTSDGSDTNSLNIGESVSFGMLSEDSGIESSYYDDGVTKKNTRKRLRTTERPETVREETTTADEGHCTEISQSSDEYGEHENGAIYSDTDKNQISLPQYLENNRYLLKHTGKKVKVMPRTKLSKDTSYNLFDACNPKQGIPVVNNNGVAAKISSVRIHGTKLGEAKLSDSSPIYQSIGGSFDTHSEGPVMFAKPEPPPRNRHQRNHKVQANEVEKNDDVLILWDADQAKFPITQLDSTSTASSRAAPSLANGHTSSKVKKEKSRPVSLKIDTKGMEQDMVLTDLEHADVVETQVPSPIGSKLSAVLKHLRPSHKDSRKSSPALSALNTTTSSSAPSSRPRSALDRIQNGGSAVQWNHGSSSINPEELQERLAKVAHMTDHVTYGVGSHQICYCKDLSTIFDLVDFDSFITGEESKSELIMDMMFRSGKIGVIGNLMFAMMRVCWFMEHPPNAEDIAQELQFALTAPPPFVAGHI